MANRPPEASVGPPAPTQALLSPGKGVTSLQLKGLSGSFHGPLRLQTQLPAQRRTGADLWVSTPATPSRAECLLSTRHSQAPHLLFIPPCDAGAVIPTKQVGKGRHREGTRPAPGRPAVAWLGVSPGWPHPASTCSTLWSRSSLPLHAPLLPPMPSLEKLLSFPSLWANSTQTES